MKKILLVILIFILLSLSATFIFLKNNTNFVTFFPDVSDIMSNNKSSKDSVQNMPSDLVNLVTKDLIVPQKFQTGVFEQNRKLNIPDDFEISVYAAGFVKPRFFDFDDNNNMYFTDSNLWTDKENGGEVFLLRDENNDGVADDPILIDDNLRVPHGIDFHSGDLYVGEENQIIVYRNINPDGSYSEKEILIPDLPDGTKFFTGSGHQTRTVKVGPDNKIYVSIGSSCNVCEEPDFRRATIARYNNDGSFDKIVAEGLRNTVGFEFVKTGEFSAAIVSVDNGRDRIGDDLPVEEINIIDPFNPDVNNNYGWPYCHGRGIPNPEYPERGEYCKNETVYPKFEMQAHSAPLGIAQYSRSYFENETKVSQRTNELFPEEISSMFIAFHGSWNRTTPTGYKIVRVNIWDFFNNHWTTEEGFDQLTLDTQPINFITGWLESDGNVWGRPVDVGFDNNGIMYITDDQAGAIYRVEYKPDQTN